MALAFGLDQLGTHGNGHRHDIKQGFHLGLLESGIGVDELGPRSNGQRRDIKQGVESGKEQVTEIRTPVEEGGAPA